jgi:homoserine trans-succinylase
MADNIQKFLAAASFNINRLAKGKTISKNIRPFVEQLIIQPMEKKIELTVRHSQHGSARPMDIIVNILSFSAEESKQIRIVKTKTLLQRL